MINTEEQFDLVNEQGEVIGCASRRECHANPDLLHRVVHVLIINSRGEILLQKRHPNKDIQPDKWDTSVGGHVNSGEELSTALIREVQEEVGIMQSLEDFNYCYTYIMRNRIESELVATYSLIAEGPFEAQPDEITELRFFSPEEIEKHLDSGFFTPNFEDEFSRFVTWSESCR